MGFDEDECLICYAFGYHDDKGENHTYSICFHCMGTIAERSDGMCSGFAYTLNGRVRHYVKDCAVCHQYKMGAFDVKLCKTCIGRCPKRDPLCVHCCIQTERTASVCIECIPDKKLIANRFIILINCVLCGKVKHGLSRVPMCSECQDSDESI